MRFMFAPISLLGLLMVMNLRKEFYTIEDTCKARDICFGFCTQDNYPDLSCVDKEIELTYNGNAYKHFFFYPNPDIDHDKTEFVPK